MFTQSGRFYRGAAHTNSGVILYCTRSKKAKYFVFNVDYITRELIGTCCHLYFIIFGFRIRDKILSGHIIRIIVSRLTHLLTINSRKAVLIYSANILIKGQSSVQGNKNQKQV